MIYLLAILLFHCGIYSTKGTIPNNIKSISIKNIENDSVEFDLGERLEESISNKLLNENFLDITLLDLSDSYLKIIIKKAEDMPYSYSLSNNNFEFEKVDEWRVQFNINAIWYDMINNEVLFDKNIIEWGAYGSIDDISLDGIDNDGDGYLDDEDSNEMGSAREAAINIAINKITNKIIEGIIETW